MENSDNSVTGKHFYSISEVSDLLGVNASALRHWEKQISVFSPQKKDNGVRLYTEKDIKIARSILNLVKNRGMTLAGADKYIAKEQAKILVQDEVLQRLEKVKKELTGLLDELSKPY